MKKYRTLLSLGSILMAVSAHAQVYSSNTVGYINLSFSEGENLVANQLQSSPDNTLDSIFSTELLSGTTFTELGPDGQPLPVSAFDGTSWSINYTLAPNGVGGILYSPSPQATTIVGQVVNVNLNTMPVQYTFVPPERGAGTYLLSMAAPFSDPTFQQIVGRNPLPGDSITSLAAPTQTYTTSVFNGTAWNNGFPDLQVDQAAYFTLVPEPSTTFLAAVGAAFWGFGSLRKHRNTIPSPAPTRAR